MNETTKADETARQSGVFQVKFDPDRLSPELKAQHAVKMPGLDANSQQDFARGFKLWLQGGSFGLASTRGDDFLEKQGHSLGDTNMDYEACYDLLKTDPVYAARLRLGWSAHDYMWDSALRNFERNRDAFLGAMEATDDTGPGTLELNPGMTIPDYARHEIHRQPGGFVGNDFAGWLYHYCLTLAHYGGRSDHDEAFFRISQSVPLPDDGQVHRILDIGCGSGLLTTACKQRFPDAECWGIDVGGPMVRYAHHRAAKMGFDVHFAQRLAEDSKFPDDHFDVVTDYLVFHEMNQTAMRASIKEIFRTLRPGGLFVHLDANTAGHPTAKPVATIAGKAGLWNVYRHNFEPWYLDYAEFAMPQMLEEAGFEVDLTGDAVLWNGRPFTVAKKPE